MNIKVFAAMALALSLALASTLPARAAPAHEISCTLHFNLHGWSVFYKTSSGTGTISCSNGQKMNVAISGKGGGLSFGKSSIENGIGKFSGVHDIHELLGGYAAAEAHAGAGKSAKAQVVTKGTISLALTGKGKGWNLGVAFGSFVISKR